jgi:serine/threonine-protein kinase
MAAWLDHPNIVRVIDCGIEDDYHYMVMDYVDGPNCLEKVKEHPRGLHWQEATHIVSQAATGLAYAAGRDVIHRDVKPSNIMIDSSGRVRVTDLGLAKLTIKGVVSLTEELHTVGTPNYMSPEQIRSTEGLDLRTDIYSLGASLYHLVAGRPPFIARTAMAVVAQHLSTPLTPPIEVREDLPPGVSSLICKMMAKHPDERYQDYDELSTDLENLVEGRTIAAEGFEESDTAFEDEESLRHILEEIRAGAQIELDEEEPPPPPAKEPPVPVPEAKAASDIDPFGPGDFEAYRPPPQEASESTVLARQLLRRHERAPLIMGLIIVGLTVLILIVGILVLWLG